MNIKIKTKLGEVFYSEDNYAEILKQINPDDVIDIRLMSDDVELLNLSKQSLEEVVKALEELFQYSAVIREIIVNYLQEMGWEFCIENIGEAKSSCLGKFDNVEDVVRYYSSEYIMFQDYQIDFLYDIVDLT